MYRILTKSKTEYETIFYYAKNALHEKNALNPNFNYTCIYISVLLHQLPQFNLQILCTYKNTDWNDKLNGTFYTFFFFFRPTVCNFKNNNLVIHKKSVALYSFEIAVTAVGNWQMFDHNAWLHLMFNTEPNPYYIVSLTMLCRDSSSSSFFAY